MRLNVFAYWHFADGYGRFSTYIVQALQRATSGTGCEVRAIHLGELERPPWLLDQLEINWSRLNLTCAPAYMAKRLPGRHWLYTMTEGSRLPPRWAEAIADSGVERVIVPCEHNAVAFRDSGVTVPVHVVPGGTDPHEFPLIVVCPDRPYTFLTLADRHERKGWWEVWDAFYLAFGGKADGESDVRLIIKSVPSDHNVVEVMAQATGRDPRVVYQIDRAADMAAVYAQADCLVLPSRSEGWGMPHREAAMCGIPVITQAYSGLADARAWAIVVEGGESQPIPPERGNAAGDYRVVDVGELAAAMRRCYEQPATARAQGLAAAAWLRANQTWDHAAATLLELIECETRQSAVETGVLSHA